MYQILLKEEDLVRSHLFNASKSEMISRIRKRNTLITAAIFIGFGLISYFINGRASENFIYFVFAGIFYYFAAPFWTRFSYKKHYQRYVRNRQKHIIDKTFDLDIQDDKFVIQSGDTESVLMFDEITSIYEISEALFIKFDEVNTIAVPKHFAEYDQLVADLKAKLEGRNIEWLEEKNWKWK